MKNIIRKEIESHHYYFIDGDYYPSVTHIIGEAGPVENGLRYFWQNNTAEEGEKIRDLSAGFGSRMHAAYERLVNGEELDLENEFKDDKARQHILSFVAWAKDFGMKSPQTEMTVYSDKYRYAGTLDLVTYHYGKLWIIDFKTSSGIHFSHEIQLAAYREAYEEMTGNKVDHVAILRTGTKHKVGYEFKEVERPFEHFKSIYDTFINMHDGKLPELPMKILNSYPKRVKL